MIILKTKNNKKNLGKKIFNVLLFIGIAFLTFWLIFKNNDIHEIMNNVHNANKIYLLLAILVMFLYIFCEGVNIYRILHNLKDKVSLVQTFKYSLVGFFFSSITPSSTGGQPMQLYFMNKDKVSISHSALALLIQLLSFQFMTLVLALIGFAFNYDILLHNIGNIKYLMFLGITINIVIQGFLIIMIFSKKLALKLINWICNLLTKLHIKSASNIKQKALNSLEEYHDCAIYLKGNKLMIIKIFLTTLIQLSLYHSIPFFVYKAFNLNEYSIFTFILLQAVLYISVASLPLPGAMGASEGSFMIIFKLLFPASLLGSAMILSRGISFYLFVFLSAILIFGFIIFDKVKKKGKTKGEKYANN